MEEIKKYDKQENPYYEYKCANGRILRFTHKSTSNKQGFQQEFEHYECVSCKGCSLKNKCLYNYNEEKYQGRNKTLKINRN